MPVDPFKPNVRKAKEDIESIGQLFDKMEAIPIRLEADLNRSQERVALSRIRINELERVSREASGHKLLIQELRSERDSLSSELSVTRAAKDAATEELQDTAEKLTFELKRASSLAHEVSQYSATADSLKAKVRSQEKEIEKLLAKHSKDQDIVKDFEHRLNLTTKDHSILVRQREEEIGLLNAARAALAEERRIAEEEMRSHAATREALEKMHYEFSSLSKLAGESENHACQLIDRGNAELDDLKERLERANKRSASTEKLLSESQTAYAELQGRLAEAERSREFETHRSQGFLHDLQVAREQIQTVRAELNVTKEAVCVADLRADSADIKNGQLEIESKRSAERFAALQEDMRSQAEALRNEIRSIECEKESARLEMQQEFSQTVEQLESEVQLARKDSEEATELARIATEQVADLRVERDELVSRLAAQRDELFNEHIVEQEILDKLAAAEDLNEATTADCERLEKALVSQRTEAAQLRIALEEAQERIQSLTELAEHQKNAEESLRAVVLSTRKEMEGLRERLEEAEAELALSARQKEEMLRGVGRVDTTVHAAFKPNPLSISRQVTATSEEQHRESEFRKMHKEFYDSIQRSNAQLHVLFGNLVV